MKKTLLETNSYLKNPAQRKRLLQRSLRSSFALEGIVVRDDEASVVREESPDFILNQ
ncbi:hypothetical protein [Geothermobacter hydrogeniphilus]|uniref:hypothetical protein n=1 Tax=Geothermobacter hydrogeniphilus TaxID=1969733 RepID=UPI001304E7C3|nr:hypothetical protein [Geothermobacter hydrogeniphilus]